MYLRLLWTLSVLSAVGGVCCLAFDQTSWLVRAFDVSKERKARRFVRLLALFFGVQSLSDGIAASLIASLLGGQRTALGLGVLLLGWGLSSGFVLHKVKDIGASAAPSDTSNE